MRVNSHGDCCPLLAGNDIFCLPPSNLKIPGRLNIGRDYDHLLVLAMLYAGYHIYHVHQTISSDEHMLSSEFSRSVQVDVYICLISPEGAGGPPDFLFAAATSTTSRLLLFATEVTGAFLKL